jgi:hypothetical protein
VLGDSTLWGYHLAEPDGAVAQLAEERPQRRFLNLSYEGGSVVNSLFALRLVLARGVQPDAVIVNLSSKEFNPEDSSYKRLQPSLERAIDGTFTARDRATLSTLPPPTLGDRLDSAVGSVWALYRQRTDVRVALFGFDDVAGLVTDRIHSLTGETRRYAFAHRPRAEAFLSTYDLEPPGPDNVEAVSLRELRNLLVSHHIPTVAFLTPTNHQLLRNTVDDPGYRSNLRLIAGAMRGAGIRVVDLDGLNVGPHFIDNDHLDADGSRVLATRLARELDTLQR